MAAGALKIGLQNQQQSIAPTLPDDIVVFHLLPLLPLRYVVRLRCVSKTWYTFLTDSQFLKFHRRCHRQIMIMIKSYPSSSLYSPRHFQSIDFDETLINFPTIIQNHTPPHPARTILGSCDGFILLDKYKHGGRLFLWNPDKRASTELPNLLINSKSKDFIILSGIGFDPISQDYKILIRFSGPKFSQIYTRKTNCWKTISRDIPNLSKPIPWTGVFVGGFLHWSMFLTSDKGKEIAIVSFDLAKEEFKLVPLPNKNNVAIRVCALDGLLCLVCFWGLTCDLWVMKEYGVKESWTILMTIPNTMDGRGSMVIQPLCFTHNGGVIVQISEQKIVRYDPKAKAGEEFKTLVDSKFSIVSTVFGETTQII